MFSAEIAVKPEENTVFEKAQIEVPVGMGDKGAAALGLPHPPEGINIVPHAMQQRSAAADSIATAHSAGPCSGLYVVNALP